jgi:hypothetical protein
LEGLHKSFEEPSEICCSSSTESKCKLQPKIKYSATKLRVNTSRNSTQQLITTEKLNSKKHRNNENVLSPQSRDHEEPAGAGTSLLGSLKALDLSFKATYMEVKARYKILAQTYHPDVHRSEVRGLTPEGRRSTCK